MEIRDATLEDIEEGIDLGAQMHQESKFSHLPYDRQKLRDLFTGVISNPDGMGGGGSAKVLVAFNGDNLVGMYAGYTTQFYFCFEWQFSDWFLFVHPDKRGGLAAVRMIREMEEWAKSKGCVEMRPAVSTGVHVDRSDALFDRLGYTNTGSTFLKTLG